MIRSILKAAAVASGLATILALTGCGGGSSDSGSLPNAAPATGSISLLIGDHPIDDYDQAIIGVEQILLLPEDDGAPIELLNDPISIDLLDLQNISELIVDGTTVTAGSYSKVRLSVTSITLNKTDDDGQVITGESAIVDVPASGKIDLNPRGSIVVAEGGELVLEIDVDLQSSVKRNAGTGELRFRPVIFIDRIDEANRGRTSRLFGVMRNIDATAGTMDLCNAKRLSNDDDAAMTECVKVSFDQNTLLVSDTAEVLTGEDLLSEDSATVYGTYRDATIQASVIAVGERPAFQELEGTVSELADERGAFTIESDELDGVPEGTEIAVRIIDGAKIIGDDKKTLSNLDTLVVGSEIEARGVVGEDDTGGITFAAFILHIENDDDDADDADSEDIELSGTLEAIDLQSGTFTLIDGDGNSFCIAIDEDTDFFRVTTTGDSSESSEITSAELAAGLALEVSGEREDGEDCIEAEDVVLLVEGG